MATLLLPTPPLPEATAIVALTPGSRSGVGPPGAGPARRISASIVMVGAVLQGSVASLYAHLVTRPTGRAVRLAIETQLQGAHPPSVSLIDFSEVVIIDFSCADEVVAKLLQRYMSDEQTDAFFVFRGVREPHRDQIEVVLERHGLAAVAETDQRSFELLGVRTADEAWAWAVLEEHGALSAAEARERLAAVGPLEALASLARRRLAFRDPSSGRVHALSRLVRHLM